LKENQMIVDYDYSNHIELPFPVLGHLEWHHYLDRRTLTGR
jgi:hypothetical protein